MGFTDPLSGTLNVTTGAEVASHLLPGHGNLVLWLPSLMDAILSPRCGRLSEFIPILIQIHNTNRRLDLRFIKNQLDIQPMAFTIFLLTHLGEIECLV